MLKKKTVLKPKSEEGNSKPNTNGLVLPSAKSMPSKDLGAYTWLIYGKKKIGKTSLVAQFPKTLIYSFENGTKALQVYQRDIPAWEHCIKYTDLLLEQKPRAFQTVAFDTGSIAYAMAMQFAGEKYSFEHPSEKKDFGASWGKVATEFQRQHLRIVNNGFGLVVTAHEKTVERETRSGTTYDEVCPLLSGQAEEFYAGIVDTVAYYHYVKGARYLQIAGDELVQAGSRCATDHFLTTKGKPIKHIPMGNSPKEAYENLVKAFDNKQIDSLENIFLTK